jgi:hypothetical protein
MKIEEGKFYKNRAGEKVGPMALRPACAANWRLTAQGLFCWWDKDCKFYTNDGIYSASFGLSPRDLIEEWEEPAALPPATEADEGWGPWNEGKLPFPTHPTKNDYREECINGVWRWQSRPRKPVIKKLGRVVSTPTKSYRVSFNEIDGVIDCSSVKMEPL